MFISLRFYNLEYIREQENDTAISASQGVAADADGFHFERSFDAETDIPSI